MRSNGRKPFQVMDLQRRGWLHVEDGNHGEYRPRPDEFGSGKWAFIRAADMDSGRVLFDSAQRINDVARMRIIKGVGAGGDVLLSHKGTVGKLAPVPHEAPPFVCSPQTTFWRVRDQDQIDRRWLYYFMCSDEFRQQLDSRKGETDMADYVSLTAQRELWVTLPSLDEQKTIARVLGVLDDKIELNRRMNQTLETLARAMFTDWFDAVVNGTEITIQELIDRGVMIIGDGYRAKRSELAPTGLPFARAGNLDGGFHLAGTELLGHAGIKAAGRKLSEPCDVVFTSKGTVGRLAMVTDDTPRFVFAPQLCFWRVVDGSALDPHVLFRWMQSEEFTIQLNAMKCQTDMADYVSLQDQRQMQITLASPEEQAKIASSLAAIDAKCTSNSAQSRVLATLRDALLPQLMSGELRVKRTCLPFITVISWCRFCR